MAAAKQDSRVPPSTPVAISSPPRPPNRISALQHETPPDGNCSPLSAPSDEDELAGASRLVADPDSPTSRLMEQAARRSLREARNGTPERRFSFLNDIARNPALAQAARLEMDAASGHSSPLATPGSGGKAVARTSSMSSGSGPIPRVTFFQHSTDIERQEAIIEQMDHDAAKESKINEGMARLMLGRLESDRAAAERVLSLLQAVASAEAAYGRAMAAVSAIKLPGEADGPSLRTAVSTFSQLPQEVGSFHSGVAETLSAVVRAVQSVVADLRTACAEIGQGAYTAQRSVDSCRRKLQTALGIHRDACRAFDAALIERQRVGSRSRSVEADPWVAEGRLVEAQVALQGALSHQRRYLAGAFRRVGELERRRVDATCAALSAFVNASHAAVLPNASSVAVAAATALAEVDCEADLEAFSAVAEDSMRNGDALSSRQAEMVDHLWRELLGSAEIVRQGDVQLLDQGRGGWRNGYAVLTRAGFLHWFPARQQDGSEGVQPSAWGADGGPTCSLNLARCEFEQGEAPCWRLIEGSSGGLNGWLAGKGAAQTLRTKDVEACMDWTADVREVIAVCTNKR